MSRSYKKFPYCSFRNRGIKREIRRHYQHSLRQKLKDVDFQISHNDYKKAAPDTWDLFCGSYYTLENYLTFERATSPPYYHSKKKKFIDEYDEEDCINHWKKWYYWK